MSPSAGDGGRLVQTIAGTTERLDVENESDQNAGYASNMTIQSWTQ